MSFAGKVVLITGASSGIGADAALHLSSRGASVVVVGRNADRVSKVAKKIRDQGSPEPLEIVADVTSDPERIIDETIAAFGKLDVLVNNAGIGIGSFDTLGSLDVYDQIMATNVRAVLALTKLAVPHLERTKGNVINVSSIASSIIIPNGMGYAMSKATLDRFTQCAAVELGRKGIRVNAINPGAIVTPILEKAGIDEETQQAFYEKCKETYPAGRVGQVADTSTAIEFLAADTSSFITGHLLYVDGGKHLVKN